MAQAKASERKASAAAATLALGRLSKGLEAVECIMASETEEGITVSVVTNSPSNPVGVLTVERGYDIVIEEGASMLPELRRIT